MKEIMIGIILIFAGAFSFAGAFFKWSFFMNNRKAKRLVNIIGEKGTRIFYEVIGVLIILGGIVSLFINLT